MYPSQRIDAHRKTYIELKGQSFPNYYLAKLHRAYLELRGIDTMQIIYTEFHIDVQYGPDRNCFAMLTFISIT